MTTKRIAAPAELAVSLSAAKETLRIEHTGLDSTITDWLKGVIAEAQAYTKRAFINQRFRATLGGFSAGPVRLEYPPLVSVESVKYYDADDAIQTLSPSLYEVDSESEPGRVVLAPGKSWPATSVGRHNAVQIEYTAGYGATDATVPDEVRTYVLARLLQQYEPNPSPNAQQGEWINGLIDDLRVVG